MSTVASANYLVLILIGWLFAIFAVIVDSQTQSPPPPPPIPPPPYTNPPPPPYTNPPPPPYTNPPPPPPPAPPSPPAPPPPMSNKKRAPPPPRVRQHHKGRSHHPPPRWRVQKDGMNTGKKVGVLFIGIGGTLQIGVAGYLVYKRREYHVRRNEVF